MTATDYPQNGVFAMPGIDPAIVYAGGDLPFRPSQAPGNQAADPADGPGRPTVLVVDDMQMVADTTAEILNRQGFRAVTAYNGVSALRLVEDLKPDYLLADIVMPIMNGVELAIAVARSQPATRIVLFSGQAGVTDFLREAKIQGYDFEILAKPIHPEKLIAYLKKK